MLPPYFSFQKSEDYFQLLKLARRSGWDNIGLATQDEQQDIKAFDALPEFKTIARPLLSLLYQNSRKLNLFQQLSTINQEILEEGNINLVAIDMVAKHWLCKTLELLQRNNIPVLLLKGAAFSESLYSADTPRPGSDIDILVTEADFEKTCTLLSEHMVSLVINRSRMATHHMLFERVFRPKEGIGPTIEIHKGLTNPHIFTINENSLWEQSVAHPNQDERWVRTLSPVHTLLHLAIHAFRDLDFCNHNLIDAHEVIHQWQPEPNILIQEARAWGAKQVLYCILKNCKTILDTTIPNSVLAELRPHPFTDYINKKILHGLTRQDSIEKRKVYRLKQLLSQLTFPDKIVNSLRFQIDYARIRVKDWESSIK